jgi:hypothetical protein
MRTLVCQHGVNESKEREIKYMKEAARRGEERRGEERRGEESPSETKSVIICIVQRNLILEETVLYKASGISYARTVFINSID